MPSGMQAARDSCSFRALKACGCDACCCGWRALKASLTVLHPCVRPHLGEIRGQASLQDAQRWGAAAQGQPRFWLGRCFWLRRWVEAQRSETRTADFTPWAVSPAVGCDLGSQAPDRALQVGGTS